MAQVEYNDEQEAAINYAVEWYTAITGDEPYDKDKWRKVFELTGYAGTGKTTTIKGVIKKLNIHGVQFAAFTGKAASVINQHSGFPAQTIHSLIYKYVQPDKEACEYLYKQLWDEGFDDYERDEHERNRIQKELDEKQKPHFELKRKDETDLADCPLLVLDECSMVGEEMLHDLLLFEVPIIALGDPGQLPPVEDNRGLFLGKPDAHLEKIHRQAEGNPIIEASFKARKGIPWIVGDVIETEEGSFRSMAFNHSQRTEEILINAGQVLCGKNDTRRELNTKMRKHLDFDWRNPYPQKEERVCCWKNDKDKGLFNGDQGMVTSVGDLFDDYIVFSVLLDRTGQEVKVSALRAYFDEYFTPGSLKQVQWWQRRDTQEFDFGYAITVHKSQGSQWENVVLVDDGLFRGWKNKREERKQFLYTAVTRAARDFIVMVR